MDIDKIRTYRGTMIHRETRPNSSGLRWWAFTDTGRILRADTLESMRELIRHYRA